MTDVTLTHLETKIRRLLTAYTELKTEYRTLQQALALVQHERDDLQHKHHLVNQKLQSIITKLAEMEKE